LLIYNRERARTIEVSFARRLHCMLASWRGSTTSARGPERQTQTGCSQTDLRFHLHHDAKPREQHDLAAKAARIDAGMDLGAPAARGRRSITIGRMAPLRRWENRVAMSDVKSFGLRLAGAR